MHLDEKILTRLLQDGLTPEENRVWAEHLSADCEVCESFLADRGQVDGIDGFLDQLLLSSARSPAAARAAGGNDLEFARIERALSARRQPSRTAVRFAAMAAAFLAVAGASFLASNRASRKDWDGVKGASAPQSERAKLQFVVSSPSADLQRGVSGMAIDSSASLHFRIEAPRPLEAALVRVSASGEPEVFFEQHIEKAGVVDVALRGAPAAYPLRELIGPQRFVLITRDGPMTSEAAGHAVRTFLHDIDAARSKSAQVPELAGIAIDVVEVTVK